MAIQFDPNALRMFSGVNFGDDQNDRKLLAELLAGGKPRRISVTQPSLCASIGDLLE